MQIYIAFVLLSTTSCASMRCDLAFCALHFRRGQTELWKSKEPTEQFFLKSNTVWDVKKTEQRREGSSLPSPLPWTTNKSVNTWFSEKFFLISAVKPLDVVSSGGPWLKQGMSYEWVMESVMTSRAAYAQMRETKNQTQKDNTRWSDKGLTEKIKRVAASLFPFSSLHQWWYSHGYQHRSNQCFTSADSCHLQSNMAHSCHSLIWLDVQIIRSTSIQRTLANREYTLNNNGENDEQYSDFTNKTKCVSNLASAGVGDLFVTTWIFKFKKQKNNPEL